MKGENMERNNKKRKRKTVVPATGTPLGYFSILPKDVVIYKIMEKLDVVSLMRLRTASKKMQAFGKTPYLWMKWFQRDFKEYHKKDDWENRYLNLWIIEKRIAQHEDQDKEGRILSGIILANFNSFNSVDKNEEHQNELETILKTFFWRGLWGRNLEIIQHITKKEKRFLEQNGPDGVRVTPLTYACKKGYIEIIKYFLTVGVNLDARDQSGHSPFARACENGQLEVIKLLLKSGVMVNATQCRYPGLALAARMNHYEVVNYLVEYVSPKIFGQRQLNTALIAATEIGNRFIVETLLDNGACIKAKDDEKETLLWIATRNGHPTVVELLLKRGATKYIEVGLGFSPLIMAVKNNILEIVECLLDNGASTKSTGPGIHQTALMIACSWGSVDIVKTLLKHGANIESTDIVGENSLLVAVKMKNFDVVKCLLKNGARVDVKDADGETPLVAAVKFNGLNIVEALLKSGANVETLHRKDQYTPLLAATRYGYREMVKLLLKYGANIEARDATEKTSLSIASSSGFTGMGMVKILLDRGAGTRALKHKDMKK